MGVHIGADVQRIYTELVADMRVDNLGMLGTRRLLDLFGIGLVSEQEVRHAKERLAALTPGIDPNVPKRFMIWAHADYEFHGANGLQRGHLVRQNGFSAELSAARPR